MICTIHQPQFMPWLGYFGKIAKSDIFVVLDDTQFKKNEWQNRNKIRTAQGSQWLTVPVMHDFGQQIMDVKINNTVDWRKKHYNSLKLNYSKAKYFDKYWGFFEKLYEENWEYLIDINIKIIHYLLVQFNIKTKLVYSSKLNIDKKATDKLIEICKQVEADTYLSGQGGKAYLELEKFKDHNISVIFQEFVHPHYIQAYDGFETHMAAVDLLFNCGGAEFRTFMKGDGL